jgi:hypothetical protein
MAGQGSNTTTELLDKKPDALVTAQQTLSEYLGTLPKTRKRQKLPLASFEPGECSGGDWRSEDRDCWIYAHTAIDILSPQFNGGDEAVSNILRSIGNGTFSYRFSRLPPNHWLLQEFQHGSREWFGAVCELLKVPDIDSVEGWYDFFGEYFSDWFYGFENIQVGFRDVIEFSYRPRNFIFDETSLADVKQSAMWAFPVCLAWIATRDLSCLARAYGIEFVDWEIQDDEDIDEYLEKSETWANYSNSTID